MDARAADALVARGEEEGIVVAAGDRAANGEIAFQRVLAGVVQVDDAHLVALAEHAQRVILNVLQIKAAELGDPQPAVQKNRQNAVVAFAVLSVDRLQKLHTFVKRQVFGQRLFDLGGVEVLAGICVQKMRFIGQIIVKRANRCNFSRSGRGIQAVVGHIAVLMQHAVTAQIGHVGVNIGQCYFFHKVEIDIHDGYFAQGTIAQRRIARLLQIAEKVAQVKKIFVDGFL